MTKTAASRQPDLARYFTTGYQTARGNKGHLVIYWSNPDDPSLSDVFIVTGRNKMRRIRRQVDRNPALKQAIYDKLQEYRNRLSDSPAPHRI